MKSLYEGILGDIETNIAKMDDDLRGAAISKEVNSFEDVVNMFTEFFGTDKPKIRKSEGRWTTPYSTIGKRWTGNRVIKFDFFSKYNPNEKPYGTLQIAELRHGVSIQWVSHTYKRKYPNINDSTAVVKHSEGLMWIDYPFYNYSKKTLVEFLVSEARLKSNGTSRTLQTIISDLITNPKAYKIAAD